MKRDRRGLTTEDAEVWKAYTDGMASSRVCRMPIVAFRAEVQSTRLDLHGYSLQSAWTMFNEFVESHHGAGSRSVTVVTGESGAMRLEFPSWCEASRFVSGFSPMPSPRGKVGSFLVRIRRSTKPEP
jgi:DNA-nicking Smr family endonuclease